MLITRYSHLVQMYHTLGPEVVFIGQIPNTAMKAAILLDLTARGVRLLPPATAQMLNGAKTAQALLLAPWMLPHTQVITRRKALLDALHDYGKHGIAAAVTKHDHLHCGHGVRCWNDLEMLYNVMSL
ncbi:MAG: hypothetical protein HKP58_09030, partial [Desulfatitalea sp.]|nr:hypothetical protein [Desulfatitalea sp.]NNK00543.1 hypothetical protein [Desulfatitalea sp.]